MICRLVPGCIVMLIEIHCYVYKEDCHSFNDSAAMSNWIHELLDYGLIELDPNAPERDKNGRYIEYRTTERGAKHIENLCDRQLPEQHWR